MITEGLQGWVTEAVYLNTSPRDLHLQRYADAGIRVIVRLSYSYAVDDGGAGTMPAPNELQPFEQACIQTLQANPHAWAFLYCNEMNNSREWPRGHDITPSYYTNSYNRVWAHKPTHCRLFPGAIDPYNPGWGDWRKTWKDVLNRITGCDGLALHAYTHGPELHKIWHDKRFDSHPLTGIFYDLRVLESQQAIVPARFAGKPQVITETNHLTNKAGIGWEPDADEWVKDAMEYFRTQSIAGACLFRYNYTDWAFQHLDKILQVLKETT